MSTTRSRSGALVIALSLVGSSVPVPLRAVGSDAAGVIGGFVATTGPRGNQHVRLRSIDRGDAAGTVTTDGMGAYSFTRLAPGNYLVELIGAGGLVAGTSAPVVVSTSHPIVRGVVVTTPAALEAGQASLLGGGGLFTSAAGITLVAAVGAGVTGVLMAVRNSKNASPSQ